jgi:hypothetical protein
MVTWDTIECIERNGIITGYAVEFNSNIVPKEIMGQAFDTSELTPARCYTFQVAGVNINGTGIFTNAMNITTDEDSMSLALRGTSAPFHFFFSTAPGPVSALMAKLGFTSIVLTWNAPREPNGVIISYEVTYRVNDSNPVTTNTTDLSTTFTIPSLTPRTGVSDILVSAYTSIGLGEATLPSIVTSDRDAYEVPCGLTTRDISISVVVTFLLTIILYTTVLLVGCTVWRHSNHAKEQ